MPLFQEELQALSTNPDVAGAWPAASASGEAGGGSCSLFSGLMEPLLSGPNLGGAAEFPLSPGRTYPPFTGYPKFFVDHRVHQEVQLSRERQRLNAYRAAAFQAERETAHLRADREAY